MLPNRNTEGIFCDRVWFAQVAEEEKPPEIEKEKEKTEDVQPDKDDADEETDVADRRPTLQRNYNADDSNPLPSTDSQRRGRTDSSMRTPSSGGPRSAGPGGQGGPGGPGGPRRFPKERGFLVRVSNPPGQHVCELAHKFTIHWQKHFVTNFRMLLDLCDPSELVQLLAYHQIGRCSFLLYINNSVCACNLILSDAIFYGS